MPIVIAIDAGTTGVRALAVDHTGSVLGWSYREFPQYFPQPGWVEHDPMEIWEAVRTTLAELRSTLDEAPVTIGITDQRETVVAWDRRTGLPRHRALVWQDRRTAARCRQLEADGHLGLVRRRTGLVLDPYFSGSKVEWLLTQGGVQVDDDLALGTIDSWLVWKLTGGAAHVTDPSNASRTMLYDIHELGWSDELCAMFGVPRTALPDLAPSSGRLGLTAGDTGIDEGIPVSGIAGDQQAALFGQGCVTPGAAKNTYGTGSFVLMNVGTACPEPVDGLLTTVAWTIGTDEPVTHYALEGAIFATGAAVQWLRDGLELIHEAAETGPLAATVPDTGGVVMVPAFTGLGSPYWDPYARGTIVGITRGTTRAHLARAVVEAMAYQTRDVIDLMVRTSGHDIPGLRVDGGAAAMDLLLQIQADQLGVPVRRPKVAETTAMGAAYLAGLAEGVWGGPDELDRVWQLDIEATPAGDRHAADQAYARWLRAVERARDWATD